MAAGIAPNPGIYRLTDSADPGRSMTVVVDATSAGCICASMERRDGGPRLGVVYSQDNGVPVLVFYADGSYALIGADGKASHGTYVAV